MHINMQMHVYITIFFLFFQVVHSQFVPVIILLLFILKKSLHLVVINIFKINVFSLI